MFPDAFLDACLVLVGHGSTKNKDSATPALQHASALRGRGIFREVREAFWKQEPKLTEIVKSIQARRVFIVPLFISEGYFSEEIIPRALGFEMGKDIASRVMRCEEVVWHYCRPVGTHERMAAVLLARVRNLVAQHPFPRAPKPAETTVFIAGHGTEQDANSRKSIDRQVELLRNLSEYHAVNAVFIEESPRISECYGMAQTRNIVVAPYFISDGLHTREDIPVLLGEPERVVRERIANRQPSWRNPTERNGKLVWCAAAVGTDPLVAEVILDRVREMAALRVGA